MNLVTCTCGNDQIIIVTPAVHKSSEEIEIVDNGYQAWNSDSSWEISDEDGARFVCEECDHSWKVDRPVTWEWIN